MPVNKWRLCCCWLHVLKFDEFISAVAVPHHPGKGCCWIHHSKVATSPHCCCLLFVSPPGRNGGSRGGQSAGMIANINRSTEDLRVKQPPTNYGRLRECWSFTAKTFDQFCWLLGGWFGFSDNQHQQTHKIKLLWCFRWFCANTSIVSIMIVIVLTVN